MKVSVQVGGQSMEIVCGRGGQNMRWLALVATQRLQLMQPRGCQRMREAGTARRGFALPQAVLSKERDGLDDPEATINQVLEDGDEVKVVLMEAVEVDDVGSPVASDWLLKAFGSGEATKRRLNGTRLRQEESKQAEIDRGGSAGVAGRRAGHGGIISDLSRRGRGLGGGFDVTVEGVAISGPLETTTEIRVAMEHDWHSANIAGLLPDPKQASPVKAILQENLPTLDKVYASTRGVIGGESTSAMSFHDFAHMLHRYGMMEYADAGEGGGEGSVEGSAAKRVFDDAKRGNWQGGGNTLNRAQFLGALVLVARSKGGRIEEVLKDLVQETLLPMHKQAMADDIGLQITRPEVQQYISDNQRLVHSVFLLYADPSEDGALITLDQFRELMGDSGVMSAMTATRSGKANFDLLAEKCFLQARYHLTPSYRLALMTAKQSSSAATNAANSSTSRSTSHQGRGKPAGSSSASSATLQQQQLLLQKRKKEKRLREQKEQEQKEKEQQQEKEPQQKELDAIYLVLDCIIDLGLGDRGLS